MGRYGRGKFVGVKEGEGFPQMGSRRFAQKKTRIDADFFNRLGMHRIGTMKRGLGGSDHK